MILKTANIALGPVPDSVRLIFDTNHLPESTDLIQQLVTPWADSKRADWPRQAAQQFALGTGDNPVILETLFFPGDLCVALKQPSLFGKWVILLGDAPAAYRRLQKVGAWIVEAIIYDGVVKHHYRR